MAFVQKTWVNKSADGTIPTGSPSLSAENLNRIEQGIADSLQKDGGTMTGDLILNGDPTAPLQATSMRYVDNNILHFHGEGIMVDDEDVVPKDHFILPEYIDPSKYTVFIATDAFCVHGKAVRLLPWDGSTTLASEGLSGSASVRLSSATKELYFILSINGSNSKEFEFDLFLVPTAQCVELSPIS